MSRAVVAPSDTTERESPRPPFGAPWVFVLAVIEGESPTRVFRVDRSEIQIGRGRSSQIRLDDEMVSKRHCRLRTEGGVCTLQDLGSRNGTQLNGRTIEAGVSRRLRHLDELQIGETRLMLLAGKHAARAR